MRKEEANRLEKKIKMINRKIGLLDQTLAKLSRQLTLKASVPEEKRDRNYMATVSMLSQREMQCVASITELNSQKRNIMTKLTAYYQRVVK